MVKKIDTAEVLLWGSKVGDIAWYDNKNVAAFEYEPAFIKKSLDISPLQMSLTAARQGQTIFTFPHLNRDTFYGLPGLFADMLPDKFGHAIIDEWLARQGRSPNSFSSLERLCYLGKRGMGALEFQPSHAAHLSKTKPVDIDELVKLAGEVIASQIHLSAEISESDIENRDALLDILRVGTSAGGARPKAVIAMNEAGHVVSGQVTAPPGYTYWLLKFDGVTDLELGEPKGYGRIEFAYYLMARQAGIQMMPSRLLTEHGRAHFLTKRFDRFQHKKIHMQTLCGLAHYDFNLAGAYSYEQAFMVMRKLKLSKADLVQQYRRMLFNVIAYNRDDHTKNITFLMPQDGKWQLSPAYDLTFAHNPAGRWTSRHQMSVNGKCDEITEQDLLTVGNNQGIPKPTTILTEVKAAISQWPQFAKQAGVGNEMMSMIAKYLTVLGHKI